IDSYALIAFYDLTGKSLFSDFVLPHQRIDTSHLPPGFYFIEVKNWKTNEPLPLEVFTQRKINKMKSLAEYYFWIRNEKENDYYVSFALIFIRKDTIEFFFDLF
ncbi:MAG: T9SS type A sorting domain-containing protein, partial [Leptospiraceae bacterium]|nr:T9SS type A sorting domain-containing protein [Leptospiraceae bacterium]